VQRLAPRVYLITPANVEVSAEERRRLMERGFFDEF
jgi:cell division inhibitor SepF